MSATKKPSLVRELLLEFLPPDVVAILEEGGYKRASVIDALLKPPGKEVHWQVKALREMQQALALDQLTEQVSKLQKQVDELAKIRTGSSPASLLRFT